MSMMYYVRRQYRKSQKFEAVSMYKYIYCYYVFLPNLATKIFNRNIITFKKIPNILCRTKSQIQQRYKKRETKKRRGKKLRRKAGETDTKQHLNDEIERSITLNQSNSIF